MKMQIVLAMSLISLVAGAAAEKSPMQCKVGFKEVARCSAIKLIGVPEGADALTKAMAEATLPAYQDIVVCKKTATNAYAQLNIPEDGKPSISPEIPARLSSTGVTHTVRFSGDTNQVFTIVYGGLAGGTGNGQLVMTLAKRGTRGDNFTYAVQCSYER